MLVSAMRVRSVLIAVLGAGLATTSCHREPPAPILLLVTVDTLRADHLGCAGRTGAATPVMDRLAREGARFTAASTVTPLTLPAHASIMTGRYPAATGVRNNGMFVLTEREVTLAEALKARGWDTAAAIGSFVLSAPFGLSQGFDVYDEAFDMRRAGPVADERRARTVNDALLRRLGTPSGRPLFLWVHYFDPHAKYEPPPPFDARFAASPYDGEIASVDEALGDLIRRLGELAPGRPLSILLTGDHGEGLGEHGEVTHGLFLYESTIAVPLIVRSPGRVPAGVVVGEPVSVVDLFDTALDLASVPAPDGAPPRHGTSLLPAASGKPATRAIPVTFEAWLSRLEFGWSELQGVRTGRLKLIDAPRPEVFDLAADPAETMNLAASSGTSIAALRAALAASYQAQSVASGTGSGVVQAVDEETQARLRSLGYTAGAAPVVSGGATGGTSGTGAAGGTSAAAPLPDPKDRLAIYERLKAAGDALTQGPEGVASAIRTLEGVLAEDPGSIAAQWRYAEALLAAGRAADLLRFLEPLPVAREEYYWAPWLAAKAHRELGQREEALRLLREATRRTPLFDRRGVQEAALLREMGRVEESLTLARTRLAAFPGDAALLELAADDARDLGKNDEALGYYRTLLAAHPGKTAAAESASRLLVRSGRAPEAEALLEALLKEQPEAATGWRSLGFVRMNAGKLPAAVEGLRAAQRIAPADPETLYYLTVCLAELGRTAEADTEATALLRAAPASPHAFRAEGMVREKQGRPGEAAAAYRRALALDPADAAAAEALRRLGG